MQVRINIGFVVVFDNGETPALSLALTLYTLEALSVTLTFIPFLRKASDWSASADLAASQTERVHNLSR